MENTVVQELIGIISKVDNDYFSKDQIILVLNNYLEPEKMQIEEAYFAGYKSGHNQNEDIDYYKETYLKQKKP